MIISEDIDFEEKIFKTLGIVKNPSDPHWHKSNWKRISTLVRCPRRTFFDLEDFEKQEQMKDDKGMALLFGKAIHSALQTMAEASEIPVEAEGMTGTMDMLYTRLGEVCEIKTTGKSLNNSVESFTLYLRQLMAYLYMYKKLEGKLIIYHKFGDYTRPFIPVLKVWKLSFTEQEILDNWILLGRHREWIDKALLTGEPPPMTTVKEECGYCPFHYVCYPNEKKKEPEGNEHFPSGVTL